MVQSKTIQGATMELIVEGRGSFLGKNQGRLRVTREQKMVTEVPLIELDQLESDKIEPIRVQILSVERRAALSYWNTIAKVIPHERVCPGRETIGAIDKCNSTLKYGYGILYSQVEQALILAGLGSYGG